MGGAKFVHMLKSCTPLIKDPRSTPVVVIYCKIIVILYHFFCIFVHKLNCIIPLIRVLTLSLVILKISGHFALFQDDLCLYQPIRAYTLLLSTT